MNKEGGAAGRTPRRLHHRQRSNHRSLTLTLILVPLSRSTLLQIDILDLAPRKNPSTGKTCELRA